MEIVDINYPAVVVATAVAMALGALWYSPLLFAERWMRAVGKTREQLQGGTDAYVTAVLGWFVAAFVLETVTDWAAATTIFEGAFVGILACLGFVATTSAIDNAFAGRLRELWLIGLGYHLLALVAIGAIVGAWE